MARDALPPHRHARLEHARAMNPSRGSVTSTRIEVRMGRGETLPGRLWSAQNPRAIVALLHGLGEHAGRYEALASDLARAGYIVAALDLPGHGETPGPRGDVPSWNAVRDHGVQALWTAPHAAGIDTGRLPRILLGHSMGAVLALDYALAHPRELTGVIASAAGLRSAMPPWWKLALANVVRVTVPSMGFPTGLEEAGMSRDPEVVRGRADDPSFTTASVRGCTRRSTRRGSACCATRDASRCPVLVLHGAADRVVDPAGSADFAGAAPKDRVKHIVYPDAYHEIFNDVGRERVVADVLAWIDRVIAADRSH
jgi:alpha-beta hydrolase superfamily lysophospholipase